MNPLRRTGYWYAMMQVSLVAILFSALIGALWVPLVPAFTAPVALGFYLFSSTRYEKAWDDHGASITNRYVTPTPPIG